MTTDKIAIYLLLIMFLLIVTILNDGIIQWLFGITTFIFIIILSVESYYFGLKKKEKII